MDGWKLLDDMLAMLQPIRDAIVALEADDTTLGTAYHYWLVIAAHLHRHLSSETMSAELRAHVIKWTNYYWKQLPHDLMAAALLLHPRLRDAVPLTIKSKKGACKFIRDCILQAQQGNPDRWKTVDAVVLAMHDYITRSGQFANPGPTQGQSDIGWWRRWFANGSPVGEAMVEVVERLHSIPPHTAAVERFYSRFGFMQRPHRSNLSVKMLVDMATVNAWLVATDPAFGKPPRAASKRTAAQAGSDGQGRASTDSGSDDSDDEDEDDGSSDDEDDAVLCSEDSPADADADDAAMAATRDDNESLPCAERLAASVAEGSFLLAMDTCDLSSPFLLAGIHGSSVAQEAPTEEAPEPSSECDDVVKAAESDQLLDRLFPEG